MSTSDQMKLFVGMSAVLTGIAAVKLAPPLDQVNVKQTYFNAAAASNGPLFEQLLNIYAANQSQPPEAIGDIILNQSGDPIRYLARSIMLAWYLGAWYDPNQLRESPPGGPVAHVLSADAYTQGWVWRVAQAHPMGYSDFQFGDWAKNPPPLSDYIQAADKGAKQ